MTLPDAIRAAGHECCIRRHSWMHGFRIRWSWDHLKWMYGNAFEPSFDPLRSRSLDLTESQGCLTPMSMTADDWEVAE